MQRSATLRVAMFITVCATVGAACANQRQTNTSLEVFAASSLEPVLDDLLAGFQGVHPHAEVRLNIAGSSLLAAQLRDGAPADVFVAADMVAVEPLVGARILETPAVFATNSMELIVAPGNPLGIRGLDDLAERPDLRLVLCDSAVPCGRYAAQLAERAGVDVVPDSYESSVRAVATKVVLGEADAGIVYRTDVLAAGDSAFGVPIEPAINVRAEYLVSVVENTDHAESADAFVAYLLSPHGRAVLLEHGFGAP